MTAPSFRFAFRAWFGLPPADAEMLAVLYGRGGGFVTLHELADLAGLTPNSVMTRMVNLRAALEVEAIDHVRLSGYRLTEGGLAECRAALCAMAEELMAGMTPRPP